MQRLLAGIICAAVLLSITPLPRLGHAQPMAFPQSEWERASPESQFVQSALLRQAVDRLESRTSSGGGVEELVVIRNGRMIWDGPQSDYAHHTWSMTKSFASTALGLLVDDGQVTLDTLAQDTVPAMAADYPDVTLRHLVTQTSGYKYAGEPYGVMIADFPADPFAPGTPLFTPAGSQFAYGSSLDQLMNVLTQVAGEPIQDLFQRRLGDPMGLAPEAWDWGDFVKSDGIAVDGGSGYHTKGVSISAQDAARLGHLFLNRGNWNGQQLISSEWVDEATRVQVPASTPLYSASPTDGPGIYGYAWWVNGVDPGGQRLFRGVPESTYVAWGYQSNLLIVIPDWDMIVVREGSISFNASDAWASFLREIGMALIEETQEPRMPPASIYTVKDNDSDSTFDDLGDVTNDLLSRSGGAVGEVDTESGNAVARLVVKFGLPGVTDASKALESAVLRLFLDDVEGTPAGPVSLLHSVVDNDRDQSPTDYEDASYTDTLRDFVQPTDAAEMYYELDVTDLVRSDYLQDGLSPQIAFRLQVNEATFVEDNQAHRYRFAMPGAAAHPPELVLMFIPEPSTFVLLATGLFGLICYGQRRSRWKALDGLWIDKGNST